MLGDDLRFLPGVKSNAPQEGLPPLVYPFLGESLALVRTVLVKHGSKCVECDRGEILDNLVGGAWVAHWEERHFAFPDFDVGLGK